MHKQNIKYTRIFVFMQVLSLPIGLLNNNIIFDFERKYAEVSKSEKSTYYIVFLDSKNKDNEYVLIFAPSISAIIDRKSMSLFPRCDNISVPLNVFQALSRFYRTPKIAPKYY